MTGRQRKSEGESEERERTGREEDGERERVRGGGEMKRERGREIGGGGGYVRYNMGQFLALYCSVTVILDRSH